nr:MAG TPA: hypothetical protein [Bacteriophage sp.]
MVDFSFFRYPVLHNVPQDVWPWGYAGLGACIITSFRFGFIVKHNNQRPMVETLRKLISRELRKIADKIDNGSCEMTA